MADKRDFGRLPGNSALLLAVVLLASCVSQGDGGEVATAAVQPAQATYRCESGVSLTIENFGASVRLTDPEGEQVELPAAPASQRSRYGQTPYALVLEGEEALYMKNGKTPLTCRR
ncbi:hypothetical protein EET67_07275 [Pseudaminobacter arsenicus]|uniref:C-type lysozyme inhibitor domain-containing protein n=1 Tax=Borborobacter arsenicus TaxID=1851146 RepID=A0A432V8C3_9HYPH|nr:hypothetical protein [Pseudaminobacter arsenicus]RUM98428.1 hypothetical protein EET67_07275 [Pseudaminobacter arsenicus]